jgi:hypothetical protein
MFDEPDSGGSGGRLRPADCVGHLLLVWVIDYIEHSPTQFTQPGKPSDAVVVDVVDLDMVGDDGQPGMLVRKEWWRPGRLVRDLKGRVGRPNPMLLQMTRGMASPGKQAPFEVVSMLGSPQAVQRGEAWRLAHQDFVPSKPDPMPSYQQPVVVPYEQQQSAQSWVPASPQPPQQTLPPPPAQMSHDQRATMLERLALQAQQGRDRLPRQEEEPPF